MSPQGACSATLFLSALLPFLTSARCRGVGWSSACSLGRQSPALVTGVGKVTFLRSCYYFLVKLLHWPLLGSPAPQSRWGLALVWGVWCPLPGAASQPGSSSPGGSFVRSPTRGHALSCWPCDHLILRILCSEANLYLDCLARGPPPLQAVLKHASL